MPLGFGLCCLVPATTVMVVMAMPAEPQDQVGPAIVGPIVVAVPMVATPTMYRSTAVQMAVPPTPAGTPSAASMVAVGFGNQTLFHDGAFSQTAAKRCRLCEDGRAQQKATSKEEGYCAVHACSLVFAAA